MGLGLISTALAASILTPVALAGASTHRAVSPKSKSTVVTADKKYFRGQTISFVIAGTPGSTNYNAAQALIPGMEAYLHCTVVLANNPTGNSISAENLAYAQPANGLTIGYLGIQGVLAADMLNQTTVNFPLRNVIGDILMGSPQGNYVLTATASSGIKSMADLSTHPVNYLLDTTSGTGNVVDRMIKGLYPNLNIKILNGYSGTTTILAGMLRGDGPLGLIPPPNLVTYVPSGQLIPLLTENKPPVGSVLRAYLDKVPTFAQYAAKHPVKGKSAKAGLAQALLWFTKPAYAFFAPPGTPKKYEMALTDAMKYATSLESTKQNQLLGGVAPGFISPAQMVPIIRSEINNDQTMSAYLNAP